MRPINRPWTPRVSLILAIFFGFVGLGNAQDDEKQPLVPQAETPESFFVPPLQGQYDQLPPVEGQAIDKSFWAPAGDAFFDSLPRALDAGGVPAEDFDEAIWEREFGAIRAADEGEWIQSAGYLEYRGSYSTNIDSSAPGIDFDLRRKGHPLERFETEVSDWSNGITLGYNHEFAIVPDTMKGAARYEVSHKNYNDEDRENSTYHFMELATITKLTENLEWEIFGGAMFDDRRSDAQYFRADYYQWHIGTELVQEWDEGKRFTAGYQFRHRDYDSVHGVLDFDPSVTENTPFFDWHEHRFWATYSHPLTDTVSLDAAMTYAKRNYVSQTLEADGGPVTPDELRHYKLYEPIIALTATPTEHTRLMPYYRYRSLQSTGSFYDYEQNAWGVVLEQDLCPERVPGLQLIARFEYSEKDYDAQVIRDGAGFRNGVQVRDDELVKVYVALERTIRDSLTTGVDFHYIDNDSNDKSSEYQEERYGVYVRFDF